MFARLHIVVLLAGWGTVAGPAIALAEGDPSREPVPAPRPLAPRADFADWIAALSSDSYAARKEATQRLIAAGPAAIAPVAEAADSDDLELPGRCIGILKRLSDADDPATKQAAEAALRELARSSREYLARRADEALREPPAAPTSIPLGRRGNVVVFGRPIVAGGRVQPQQGNGGNVGVFRPVRVQPPQERMLVRELTVDDNRRKVHLRYENRGEKGSTLIVQVIEPLAGQDRITEYKADSINELREKHPEGYALYAKHSRELYRQPARPVPADQPPVAPPGILVGGRVQVQVVPLQREAVPAEPAGIPLGQGQIQVQEAMRRLMDARRRTEDRQAEQQRTLMRRYFEQHRRAAELQKQLLETSARLRKLAARESIRPEDLRHLAERLERVSAPRRPDEPEAVPAPRPAEPGQR